jgi:hypothetical protein
VWDGVGRGGGGRKGVVKRTSSLSPSMSQDDQVVHDGPIQILRWRPFKQL